MEEAGNKHSLPATRSPFAWNLHNPSIAAFAGDKSMSQASTKYRFRLPALAGTCLIVLALGCGPQAQAQQNPPRNTTRAITQDPARESKLAVSRISVRGAFGVSRPCSSVWTGCHWSVRLCGGLPENPTYQQMCTASVGSRGGLPDPVRSGPGQLPTCWRSSSRRTIPPRSIAKGNDSGTQYRSAMFYHDDEQRELAEKRGVERLGSGPTRS